MSVDPEVVQWLKGDALYVGSTDADTAARWGDLAAETDAISPLALPAGAAAEGVRQLAFLKGPLVADRHRVPGLRRDLLGKAITIVGDRLGYAGGVTCFVIAYEELKDAAHTMLTVLRRL